MRTLFLIPSFLISAFIFSQGVYQANYTAGDIDSDKTFQTWPGSSICPATLMVNVPAGEMIDSTRVQYSYFSSLAGFGGTFQQRSYMVCPTTGQDEGQLFTCNICAPTTEQYDRYTHIADGISTGSVEFEMHLGTTGTFGANCTDFHFIQNGTWVVTVYTSMTVGVNDLSELSLQASIIMVNGGIQIIPEFTGETDIRAFDVVGKVIDQRSALLQAGQPMYMDLPDGYQGVLVVSLQQGGRQLTKRVQLDH